MKYLSIILLAVVLFSSCKNNDAKTIAADSIALKTVRISIDESFEPVMKEQLKVFELAYPDTRLIAEYKPEAACLRDLQNDSTKIAIISRELNRTETAFYESKIGYKPEFAQLAKDAVAVVVNTSSADSSFTIDELRSMLNGKSSKTKVAIDGNTATSTVRYLKDSLLLGSDFGTNVTGAANSEALVQYIAETPGAVGFAGVSWITNPQNGAQEALLKNVKMALIECKKNCEKGEFARPSQQTITFEQYPLVRGLYYVLKENYAGMGSRLIEFLSTERGQLIFRRASLVPIKMNFSRRRTSITDSK